VQLLFYSVINEPSFARSEIKYVSWFMFNVGELQLVVAKPRQIHSRNSFNSGFLPTTVELRLVAKTS
jgi:hypothetical protein